MKGVNLARYRFDYDLTFAVLFCNADGTTYARYGGRDSDDASDRLSMKSLVATMKAVAKHHLTYAKAPQPPKLAAKRTIADIQWFAKRKQPDCVHCHMVNDARMEQARIDGKFDRDAILERYPLPEQVGLLLKHERDLRVKRVAAKSAAEKAGVRVGDVIRALGGRMVFTEADVSHVLHSQPRGKIGLELKVARGAGEKALTLELAAGWKRPTSAVFAWRPTKWRLGPSPGFGGRPLDDAAKRAAGLPPKDFAFRVGYVVTWGAHSYTGRAAHKAGIRKGDIVFGIDGPRRFPSMHHFHSWVRMHKKAGDVLRVDVLRGSKRHVASITLTKRKPER